MSLELRQDRLPTPAATHLCVPEEHSIHVRRAELAQPSIVTKYDDADLRVGQSSQLVGLFEETCFAFEKSDLSVSSLFNLFDLDLLATHGREVCRLR